MACETDRELAVALGVTEGWLRKWKARADAPEGRTELTAIEAALAPMGVTIAWLYDGQGQPPEPRLWKDWLSGFPATAEVSASPPMAKGKSVSQVVAERDAGKKKPGKTA